MNKYLTSLIAIHDINGQLGKWPGPIIEANSMEEADEWCKKNTQYLFVEQEDMFQISTNSQLPYKVKQDCNSAPYFACLIINT